jgi:DNA-directed RNA polymerase specialized sigma24 family protein
VPAPADSASGLSPGGRRILAAVGRLPEGGRAAFDRARTQGMAQPEAAGVLGVSVTTVRPRLGRGLRLPAATLGDLHPADEEPDAR